MYNSPIAQSGSISKPQLKFKFIHGNGSEPIQLMVDPSTTMTQNQHVFFFILKVEYNRNCFKPCLVFGSLPLKRSTPLCLSCALMVPLTKKQPKKIKINKNIKN